MTEKRKSIVSKKLIGDSEWMEFSEVPGCLTYVGDEEISVSVDGEKPIYLKCGDHIFPKNRVDIMKEEV